MEIVRTMIASQSLQKQKIALADASMAMDALESIKVRRDERTFTDDFSEEDKAILETLCHHELTQGECLFVLQHLLMETESEIKSLKKSLRMALGIEKAPMPSETYDHETIRRRINELKGEKCLLLSNVTDRASSGEVDNELTEVGLSESKRLESVTAELHDLQRRLDELDTADLSKASSVWLKSALQAGASRISKTLKYRDSMRGCRSEQMLQEDIVTYRTRQREIAHALKELRRGESLSKTTRTPQLAAATLRLPRARAHRAGRTRTAAVSRTGPPGSSEDGDPEPGDAGPNSHRLEKIETATTRKRGSHV